MHRLCSRVFFNRGQKWWRKLNRIVTSSALLQKWHIHMNIGINKKAISSSLHWYETWLEKSYTHCGSGSQRQGRVKIWRVIFIGGYLLRKAVRHPSWKILVIIFIWIDKGHIVINSGKTFEFWSWLTPEMLIWLENSTQDISISEDFPVSPLEASSRLPRSRDHLFSHSMSKASLPQGPNMWYLTFYENKVPIYQTTISNSL